MEKLFGWVTEKGPINVSTEKMKNPGEYEEKVESVRVSKNSSDECQKSVLSVWVPGKGRILGSVEKLFDWVPEKGQISVSTEKW